LADSVPYFNVSEAPTREAAEAFIASVDPIFDCRAADISTEDLRLELEACNAGAMLLGRSQMQGASFAYERDRAKVARTGLDMIFVQIISEGSDVRLHGDEAYVTRPGDVCIEDMTRPFATRAQTCGNFSLVLERAALGQDEAVLDGLHGLVLKQETLAAQLLNTHVRTLWAGVRQIKAAEAAAAAQATGLLLGALAAPLARSRDGGEAVASALLQRVKRYIQHNLALPGLTPDAVAQAMGMSRATLYRVCASIGGVGDYIRRQRLQRVFSDLGDPRLRHKSIAEVAYSWGFNDWSAFSRAFKSAFDMTPTEARGLGGFLPHAEFIRRVRDPHLHLPYWLREMDGATLRGAA
jgi:AraC-like DNA-binding protein